MQKEKKPVFKRSFVPRIFFVIIAFSLIITLNITNKRKDAASGDGEFYDNTICTACCVVDKNKLCMLSVKPDEIKTLTLYVDETCPYSARVTDFLKKEKIYVSTKNINKDKRALKELSGLTGGKQQVPCLKMGDSCYVLESLDIIKQLKHVKHEFPVLLTKTVVEQAAPIVDVVPNQASFNDINA